MAIRELREFELSHDAKVDLALDDLIAGTSALRHAVHLAGAQHADNARRLMRMRTGIAEVIGVAEVDLEAHTADVLAALRAWAAECSGVQACSRDRYVLQLARERAAEQPD